MLSKKNEQYIRSLSLKKFRQKYKNFIIEGDKMVSEALRHPDVEIEQIFALPDWLETHAAAIAQHRHLATEITERELKKVSTLKTPNQALAILKQFQPDFQPGDLENKLSLYLDHLQNPGNLGTILRTADWFGIDWVVCSPDCADLYNPKTVQATMSALFSVKVVHKDFSELAVENLNLSVYGAILEGENLFEQPLTPDGLIVIGSEGRGIRPALRKAITHPIAIPSFKPGGAAESLNAAIATGVICAAFRKS